MTQRVKEKRHVTIWKIKMTFLDRDGDAIEKWFECRTSRVLSVILSRAAELGAEVQISEESYVVAVMHGDHGGRDQAFCFRHAEFEQELFQPSRPNRPSRGGPGTPCKIRDMRERAESGQELFHDDDPVDFSVPKNVHHRSGMK